ncbi:uncharacterized protein LOC123003945 [Tribolium madens]|uniref:uncharacterized protein LOC123003945 n=1 Tax=Tribolium madens TaxID=41895 RepID=UPI001CF727EE|nr:uncharacterized protein LOC123003945 [Tribolium madens]
MHFWIDKRSQGCGFSGYGRSQRFMCGGFYPKPMVTPVHRFQSIESVANSGLRYARSSGYHSRAPLHCQPSVHYNGAATSVRNNSQMGRSLEIITTGQIHTPTPRRHGTPTAKFKCGVWVFFAIVTFFLAGAKYYFHGVNIGMEAFAFCSLLVIILIIGGLVSLYEAITATANAPQEENVAVAPVTDQEDTHNQVPSSLMPPAAAELPPPPYHIAIMLPSQNDTESVQIIRDSPPPSYEKAVT